MMFRRRNLVPMKPYKIRGEKLYRVSSVPGSTVKWMIFQKQKIMLYWDLLRYSQDVLYGGNCDCFVALVRYVGNKVIVYG